MIYHCFDSVDDGPNGYTLLSFQAFDSNEIPPHALKLKINCAIILPRNIYQTKNIPLRGLWIREERHRRGYRGETKC